jgi:RNA polymerase sigma factor (sigma-70 family)
MNEQDVANQLFHEYKHLPRQTILRMFPHYKGICEKFKVEPDDLFQYANEGLWQSAMRFDETKGDRTFKNFAITQIRRNVVNRLKTDCKTISFKGIGRTGLDCNHIKQNLKFVSLDDVSSINGTDEQTNHELFGDDFNLEGEVVGNILTNMVIDKYPERTVTIIKGRLEGKKFIQIGNELGLSKERVRQIFTKVKNELQGVI